MGYLALNYLASTNLSSPALASSNLAVFTLIPGSLYLPTYHGQPQQAAAMSQRETHGAMGWLPILTSETSSINSIVPQFPGEGPVSLVIFSSSLLHIMYLPFPLSPSKHFLWDFWNSPSRIKLYSQVETFFSHLMFYPFWEPQGWKVGFVSLVLAFKHP